MRRKCYARGLQSEPWRWRGRNWSNWVVGNCRKRAACRNWSSLRPGLQNILPHKNQVTGATCYDVDQTITSSSRKCAESSAMVHSCAPCTSRTEEQENNHQLAAPSSHLISVITKYLTTNNSSSCCSRHRNHAHTTVIATSANRTAQFRQIQPVQLLNLQ